ncbi:hypothetical protein PROFUN_02113 [Planoprotostelium fungivorum]|uniref:Thioesterase domain-containing protein n=1 Tax=Planoprotostelium fungivorum TaxID=1890364 RepID=A0A2P6NZ79_9EUKA|nr:hypothetical protein PROFUN_02113 [Planoprotostelium fungivorum]
MRQTSGDGKTAQGGGKPAAKMEEDRESFEAAERFLQVIEDNKNWGKAIPHARIIQASKQQTTVELDVTKDLTNMNGVLHGGACATIIDVYTSLAIAPTATTDFWSRLGVTLTLSLITHSPAPEGCTIVIKSKILRQTKRTASIDCEITDKKTGKLIATGTHIKVDPLSGNLSRRVEFLVTLSSKGRPCRHEILTQCVAFS